MSTIKLWFNSANQHGQAICSTELAVRPLCSGWRVACLVHEGAGEGACLGAHAPWHLFAGPHLARVLACPDRAARSVRQTVAMRCRLAGKSPLLHYPLKPLPNSCACTMQMCINTPGLRFDCCSCPMSQHVHHRCNPF